jgi:hypothetical protein
MYHYLEHTREPFSELDAAAKILPVGGYLLVELPNPESWFGRVLGRMWMSWFQPQHQHMIPVRNLVQALAVRGLSTVAVERGAAHRYGDLFTSLALALFAVAPDPRLPCSRGGRRAGGGSGTASCGPWLGYRWSLHTGWMCSSLWWCAGLTAATPTGYWPIRAAATAHADVWLDGRVTGKPDASGAASG